MLKSLVMTSDLVTGAVGGGTAMVYKNAGVGYAASRSATTAIVARLVTSAIKNQTNLSTDVKNQLVVAAISATDAYVNKRNPVKGAVTGVSVDLIANEIMRMLGLADAVLIGLNTDKATGTSIG